MSECVDDSWLFCLSGNRVQHSSNLNVSTHSVSFRARESTVIETTTDENVSRSSSSNGGGGALTPLRKQPQGRQKEGRYNCSR